MITSFQFEDALQHEAEGTEFLKYRTMEESDITALTHVPGYDYVLPWTQNSPF